jgi:hypothetical protein
MASIGAILADSRPELQVQAGSVVVIKDSDKIVPPSSKMPILQFTTETATQKVKKAQDLWNTKYVIDAKSGPLIASKS